MQPPPRGDQLPDEILEARQAAADAVMAADEADRQARQARRRANSKTRHYENLLLEFQGQQRLPYEEPA